MDAGEFADAAFVADFQARRLTVVFQVLRVLADRGELKDPGSCADGGVARDYRAGTDPGAGADADVGADNRARADLDGRIELGAFVDRRRGMNAAGYRDFSSTSIAESSASAANSPLTRASPAIRHSGRWIFTALTSILS